MAIQGFDQLNIVQRRSIPYREYYGDMDLTKEQKTRRENLAFILEDIIAIWLIVMEQNIANNNINEARDKQRLTYMIYDEISDKGYFENDLELNKYVGDFVNETYRSTVENRQKYPDDVVPKGNITEPESVDDVEPYWTSEDRAKFIAENEANTLINTAEYTEAKAQGYTHKIWMSYGDERVRATHQIVDGAKVPIGVYFDVGAARMLYPKDVTSELSTGAEHPEEVISCRCTIKYV